MTVALLIRPHARYQCHGDGTCCTSIHLLGPLTKKEAKIVRNAAPTALGSSRSAVVSFHEGNDDLALVVRQHRCVFLNDQAQCRLHLAVGEGTKPNVCRRFPVGATQTPQGIRVTLSHRCPCVSIGQAPELDAQRAKQILSTPNSRHICSDVEIDEAIRWRGNKTIAFEDYVAWEKGILQRLLGSAQGPEQVCDLSVIQELLGMRDGCQLPDLKKRSWDDVSKKMLTWVKNEAEDDGFFCTIRWAALELRSERYPWRPPLQPWHWTFERTAARVKQPFDTRTIFATWVADYLWSMAWSVDGSVYRALADMQTRYALANRLMHRLHGTGTRKDLAAAEAIMIVDTVASSEPWEWIKKGLTK